MGDRKKVYHYTDEAGLKGILQSGKIKESTRSGGDAVYGDGAYATGKRPEHNTSSSIAKNNYDGATAHWQRNRDAGKADYAVELKASGGKFSKAAGGRDVYVHKGDINLQKQGTGKVYVPDGSGGYQKWSLK